MPKTVKENLIDNYLTLGVGIQFAAIKKLENPLKKKRKCSCFPLYIKRKKKKYSQEINKKVIHLADVLRYQELLRFTHNFEDILH